MKIAFLDLSTWDYKIESAYQIPLGGSQSALCYLAENLAKQGHEIFLLNGTKTPGRSRGVSCLPLDDNDDIRQLFRSLDAAIVLNQAGWGKKLKPLLGYATKLFLWTQQVPSLKAMQALGDRAELDAYDRLIFVSNWQRDRFLDFFAIDLAKTVVLRNAIAPAFANLFPEQTNILAAKTNPPILAYTSTPFRGLDLLLSIFPKIREAIPGTRLQVFSSKKVYQMATELDESVYGILYQKCRQMEGVEYIGSIPQPQLAEKLRSIAMLAYANTFEETSCIAVVEAMASGCFVVTSELAALPETTAGFGHLVSVEGVEGFSSVRDWQFSQRPDWQNYADRFLEKTVQVLRNWQSEESASLLKKQVEYIQKQCTWTVRSREWVRYLEQVCGINERKNPEIVRAIAREVRGQLQQGNTGEAIARCQRAIVQYPQSAILYKSLGNALQTQGKIDAAIRAYAKAIELDPNFAEARANLGSMYYHKRQLVTAINFYKQAIELEPNLTGVYWNLSKVLEENGQLEEAKIYRDRAMERSVE
ncbi:tetratricopeptide repeat protein [Oxynema sp. CENA135]|uniref:tetratricopeptide repeat protein n=1 Tax=Oxynema sp. CENA135 TaxID=984206 RepID=UPI00190CADAE|nr:tetratricopeptide repeat protein [Oxynema sp. CENA135]MBK4728909.1 tetratricopeptide repeat protein [Oxynema sp. CENA135]